MSDSVVWTACGGVCVCGGCLWRLSVAVVCGRLLSEDSDAAADQFRGCLVTRDRARQANSAKSCSPTASRATRDVVVVDTYICLLQGSCQHVRKETDVNRPVRVFESACLPDFS